ncbi:ISAzvi6-like transposase [Pseudomonas chlororaphis subsp. aureofaciens 30-84]|nr:ISAzvi6-like transposase [Pseudomonas chlororaphis subsp. aureofaciens 30-84]
MQRIPDHSVALFDKGFWGAELLSNLDRTGKTQLAPNSGQKKSPYLSIRGFSVWSG